MAACNMSQTAALDLSLLLYDTSSITSVVLAVCLLGCSVAQSCPTLQPHGPQPTRLLCPCDFTGKNTGVGCHLLRPGIFLTQGRNPRLLHLLALAGRFFTSEPPGKPCSSCLRSYKSQTSNSEKVPCEYWLLAVRDAFKVIQDPGRARVEGQLGISTLVSRSLTRLCPGQVTALCLSFSSCMVGIIPSQGIKGDLPMAKELGPVWGAWRGARPRSPSGVPEVSLNSSCSPAPH